MKKELSRKAKRQLKCDEEIRDIRGVMLLTDGDVFAWESFYAGNAQDAKANCYHASAIIDGKKIKFQCVAIETCENLGIFHYEASRVIYRNRNNKGMLDHLLALIKSKIQIRETLEKKSEEDTDTRPLPSAKEDKETKLLNIRKHHEELQRFLEFLRKI